jgi:hypothetical protein
MPDVQLSRLRDIGWALWDPIGLRDANARWSPNDLRLIDGQWAGSSVLGEYDGYLLQVVSRLRRGDALTDVSDYLVRTETVDLFGALEPMPTSLERAIATIEAVANYLKSIQAGALLRSEPSREIDRFALGSTHDPLA